MRDAQSKLDQVIAFTGKTITRRRRGDGARAGRPRPAARHACRRSPTRTRRRRSRSPAAPSRWATTCALVCRELSRVVRDLLVLSVDPSRISDPEIAGEGERDRLMALAGALLARGSAARVRSADARRSRHPRRRAAALSPRDGAAAVDPPAQAGADRGSDCRRGPAPVAAAGAAAQPARAVAAGVVRRPRRRPARRRAPVAAASAPGTAAPAPPARWRRSTPAAPPPHRRAGAAGADVRRPPSPAVSRTRCSPRFAKSKAVFYNMVVAQAQKIEVAGDRVTFTFSPTQRALRDTFEQNRAVARVDRRSRSPAARSPWSRLQTARGEPRRPQPARSRPRQRRPTRNRRCASRRWPTPASRRCSKCFPRRSATSRRCE